jgi:DTW domain-containing protein YfiP
MHKASLLALPPQDRRNAQVSLLLEREKLRSSNHCACGTLRSQAPALCLCRRLSALASTFSSLPHAVSVFLHPRELHRNNSTHHLIVSLLRGHGEAVVVAGGSTSAEGGEAAAPSGFQSATAAFGRIQASCEAAGRTPLVLFPCAAALTVEEWRKSAPSASAHVVLLDSTWSEAQCVARELASRGATFVKLGLPEGGVASLFQACRRQPAEGKVCTAEALAYFFEELGGGCLQGLPGGSSGSTFAGPHLHTALLPSLTSHHAKALLTAVAMSVDRQVKQTGMLGSSKHSRGAGFRTWELGEGAGPLLGALPAHVLERVAELAYGRSSVCPSGYYQRGRFAKEGGGEASAPPWVEATVPLARCSKALLHFSRGQWL